MAEGRRQFAANARAGTHRSAAVCGGNKGSRRCCSCCALRNGKADGWKVSHPCIVG
jgi:hypothetical protein